MINRLLKLSSESLAGRIVYSELCGFNRIEINQLVDQNTHWLGGSFPEPVLSKNIDFKNIWYEAFLKTYIERDIPLFGLSTSAQIIQRCLSMLAHSSGQILNKSLLARSLDIRGESVSEILDYFESTFIIRRLEPFYTNLKKRIIKSPKVLIRDTGLLHHLLRINSFDMLLGHPNLGLSWESFVVEQIISMLATRYNYCFFRTQEGAESDFLICDAGNPVSCVEVKYSSSPKRTKSLTTAIQSKRAIV